MTDSSTHLTGDNDAITLRDAPFRFGIPERDLRMEVKRGTLDTFWRGGNEYTTEAAFRTMMERCRIIPPPQPKRPNTTALYRHFDCRGRLLYVGIAIDPISRLKGHERQAGWYHLIARIEIKRYPSRKAALRAETAAIHDERPKYNIAGASR